MSHPIYRVVEFAIVGAYELASDSTTARNRSSISASSRWKAVWTASGS